MKVIISNVKRCTIRDFPGVLASKLILGGCSLNCANCEFKDNFEELELKDVEKLIDVNANAVFLGSCEPLHQFEACKEIAKLAKSKKLKVGINTLGIFEDKLRKIVESGLVDFVRFEFRFPLDYAGFSKEIVNNIKASIGFVRASGINYEFYVKLNENFNVKDIEKIYKQVLPCNVFVLDNSAISKENVNQYVEFAKGKDNIVLRFWS